ncbi:MAG TPA: MGMT family protein [bacterium]|nr:MGMT family protein [bacterium]
MKTFKDKVLNIVSNIPKGKTITYKEVAILAGSPKAYRAVGNIMSKNFDPNIPCHRVIRSDGKVGKYNRGDKRKEEILIREGAIIAKY